MTESFYLPVGDDVWLATAHTAGPWDAGSQHGGPPCALMGRAIERCQPREEMFVARFTCELLGPVPVGELTVRARVARAGRSVELLEATTVAGGSEVARASAWRVLRAEGADTPARPLAPPFTGLPEVSPPEGWGDGYLSAIEWRLVHGDFSKPGPAALWTRMRHPLVPDEETSPLSRVLTVADSGSGVSGELDFASWHFINPELTVHLHRDAVGEWICLDARTTISHGGAGLAETALSDLRGHLGVGAQSLLVRHR